MAIPLGSYIQPGIVMSVIPFGIVGAIIGHILMGANISIMSMCGIVALSGVVVNDSLVLVDYLKSKERFITIKDHVNKTGYNFLRSKTPFKKRETFPDMSKVYFSKNGEVVFSVGSSFRDGLDINHNYTSWIGPIATVWKYIGVDIYGFAYTKEFKFDSILKHIKGELL